MYGPGDGGWWGFGMMIVAILFLTLIVVGVVLVVRSSEGGRTTPRSEGRAALDVLDERFARGEIDQKEYEERRRTLTARR